MKLSDVSPLAAMVTGEGTMGNLMASGFGGMIPSSIASAAKKKRDAEEATAAEAAAKRQAGMQMKKGGTVRSASSRADGIASRGKTRGKIY